ncbi:MAG: low molecular weight phosphotyrosine protein phosphatase [Marmoricola sp.]|nr:low molecular weight phosphotyrosine protein phosphatase [Marmoricola sp.]
MTQAPPAPPAHPSVSAPGLARRLSAEFLGTALLVTVVVGSGIAAQRLSPDDVGLQLLENSIATAFGLAVLILAFGPISGAHFNPVVSAADWLLGRLGRARGVAPASGLTGADVATYTLAQVLGAIVGAELANVMYQVPLGELSTHDRTGANLLVGEVTATAGLVVLIFALARTGRGVLAAPAVGAYIGAAYWFTSSTSFANPAVTIGRVFSDTFAGIAPGSVPGFVAAQLVGLAVAVALVHWFYPDLGRPGDTALDDVVVPRARTPTDPGRSTPVTSTTREADAPERTPQVVFACVRNGGRSVISRVLTEHYARGAVTALSAGTQPGEHIHAEVAEVLEKLGLDTSKEQPKLLTRDTIAASTMAITLGCGEECPYVPGVKYVDWPVADPGGQDESAVRDILADLDVRVRALLVEMVPDIELPPSVLDLS